MFMLNFVHGKFKMVIMIFITLCWFDPSFFSNFAIKLLSNFIYIYREGEKERERDLSYLVSHNVFGESRRIFMVFTICRKYWKYYVQSFFLQTQLDQSWTQNVNQGLKSTLQPLYNNRNKNNTNNNESSATYAILSRTQLCLPSQRFHPTGPRSPQKWIWNFLPNSQTKD